MKAALDPTFIEELKEVVGEANLITEPAALQSGSRDSFHFSPVLIPQLEGKAAQVIVKPQTQTDLYRVLALAVRYRVPVTPRGAGTGNYGQGVPLHGGVLVNTKHMNRILEVNPDCARVEAGTLLWQIEKAAWAVGAELRIFPSTMPTATAAGFITGGSGGVGSIRWGMLSDDDNVRAVKILTLEDPPRAIELSTAEDIRDVLHNCGLTAFVTEATLALAPKTQWHQYVFAFDNFTSAVTAAESLAYDNDLKKRLCSVFEWPIPSYFLPLVKRGGCPEGKALLFLVTDREADVIGKRVSALGGDLSFYAEPEAGTSRGFQLYDFTWNHTTMWAMKSDKALTYLQDGFSAERLHDQLLQRKARFGDQVLTHLEFLKANGEVRPGGLSVVRFRNKDDLWGVIDWCEQHGIRVANPHTHYLDDDVRWYGGNFLAARKRWDPFDLFNPGHLKSLEDQSANPMADAT